MDAVTITSTGLLDNESPTNGALNPWECHYYEHQIEFTEDLTDLTLEHIAWSLEGDVPNDIVIDIDTGLISGIIKPFPDQPSCQNNYPVEKLKHDGSNYNSSGRFKENFYDFNMVVKREYKTLKDDEEEYEFEIATSDIIIREVKDNDIDNLIFCHNYLSAIESEETYYNETAKVEETEIIEHKITIGHDDYTIDNFDDLIANHPGPFNTDCVN